MSDGFAYIDIIIFAMVAAFLVLRLRNVLGRKTGSERRRPTTASSSDTSENVVRLPDSANNPPEDEDPAIADVKDPSIKKGLTDIRLNDPHFDLSTFLQGSRGAFSMIIEAFARGDRVALEPLLAKPVLEGFTKAIDQRLDDGHELRTEIVAVRKADVHQAAMNGPFARVTVRFVSDQINATMDGEGQVVDGDPTNPQEVIDLWTFERDSRSNDPNWELVETRTPD